jgi:hypothetical protein
VGGGGARVLGRLKEGFRRKLQQGLESLNQGLSGGSEAEWRFQDRLLVFKHTNCEAIVDAVLRACGRQLRIEDDRAPRFLVVAHVQPFIARINVCRIYFGLLCNV